MKNKIDDVEVNGKSIITSLKIIKQVCGCADYRKPVLNKAAQERGRLWRDFNVMLYLMFCREP